MFGCDTAVASIVVHVHVVTSLVMDDAGLVVWANQSVKYVSMMDNENDSRM